MNIGDTVIIIKIPENGYRGKNRDLEVGDYGVVCDISDSRRYGVDWGRGIFNGHSCNGSCEDGFGFYIDRDCVEVTTLDNSEFIFDEDAFVDMNS